VFAIKFSREMHVMNGGIALDRQKVPERAYRFDA